MQQNGSIYIHVYFTKSGFHPDPRQKNLYRRLATVHTSRSTARGTGGQRAVAPGVVLGKGANPIPLPKRELKGVGAELWSWLREGRGSTGKMRANI